MATDSGSLNPSAGLGHHRLRWTMAGFTVLNASYQPTQVDVREIKLKVQQMQS
jgi:hypothetical protein